MSWWNKRHLGEPRYWTARYRKVLLIDGKSHSHVVDAVSCLAHNHQRRPTVATWPCALFLAAFRLHTWHSWLGLDLGWLHSRGPCPDANPRLLLLVSCAFCISVRSKACSNDCVSVGIVSSSNFVRFQQGFRLFPFRECRLFSLQSFHSRLDRACCRIKVTG
jgi:hypothetical protein